MPNQRSKLTLSDRIRIEVLLREGRGVRTIAREIGRSAGTVSDEVNRHGGPAGYRAADADRQVEAARLRSGRKLKIAPGGPLMEDVTRLLLSGWSPEQISGRRKRMVEGLEQASGLTVSHEAIYLAIYAMPRGELRRELIACLRQGKPHRGRRSRAEERRGKLVGMANIRERPEEVEGRLVPGHWEGDLILGAGGASAVGTLVERTTRFVMLVRMPTRKADAASGAFAGALNAVPAALRKTLTYDQGKEMAHHQRLAEATGMKVFFADPHAPWQRGSNENTNGLLRQYLPRGASMSGFDQDALDEVADRLNNRPRKTLGFATPAEEFSRLIDQSQDADMAMEPEGVRYGS